MQRRRSVLARLLAPPCDRVVSGDGLVKLNLLAIQVTHFLLGRTPRVSVRNRGKGLVQRILGRVHQVSRGIWFRGRGVTTALASE